MYRPGIETRNWAIVAVDRKRPLTGNLYKAIHRDCEFMFATPHPKIVLMLLNLHGRFCPNPNPTKEATI